MPEEPATPAPESSPSFDPTKRVGTGFVGETTRSISGSSPTPPGADSTTLSEEGTVLRPATQQREVIGDFEIISKLGQGGMGAVYRARQVSLDRQVALKILPATLEADADFVSRFQREARVAASLSHGNLVKVFSSGQADGCHFIAMELIEGETLGQWLKRSGALPPQEALRICADVARALEHGWNRAQLIHRDIKPGNIFLSIHGDVKVGDLGLAKTLGGDTTGLTQTGTAMGTPHYINPEQARGDKDLDFRADIYSLGCTLYQMLTARTPYEGRDPVSVMHQHIHGPPPAILKVLPSCPIPLARLVGKMLKKVKRERHTSYAELLAQIESVQVLFAPTESALESTLPPDPDATLLATPGQTPRSGSATPATAPLAPPTTRPAPAGPKSKAALYGAFAAGVVVLAAVAFFAWPKEEKLTKAQLYAQQREAEAATRAAAATPAPSALTENAAAAAVPYPTVAADGKVTHPVGVWTRLLTAEEEAAQTARRDGEWMLANRSTAGTARTFTNGGLRARFRGQRITKQDINFPQLLLRTVAFRNLNLTVAPGGGVLMLRSFTPGAAGVNFAETWLQNKLREPSREYTMEFYVIGSTLIGRLDGETITAQLPDPVRAGTAAIYYADNDFFRDAHFLNLDGLPEAEARKLVGLPPAEPWQDVLRDPARLALSGGAERTAEGLRFGARGAASIVHGSAAPHDGAVRMRAIFGEARVELRAREMPDGSKISLKFARSKDELVLNSSAGSQHRDLRSFRVTSALKPGQEYELELRAVGQTFTVKFNGVVLGSVTDGTVAQGSFAVATIDTSTPPVVIKSLEFLDLDAPGGTSGAVVRQAEVHTFGGHRYQLVPGLITWTEAKAKAEAMGGHLATFTSEAEERWVHEQFVAPRALSSENAHLYYVGGFAEQGSSDFRWVTGEPMGKIRWKGGNPHWRELENNAVTKSYGGVRFAAGVAMGREDKVGWFVVAPSTRSQAGGFLVEWDDAGPATSATPATATKDAPFVNSLGMKFVPVPITGGPTDGQRILFSIWEMRVQDYNSFPHAAGRGWKYPGGKDSLHPATDVSWEDAQQFCLWLTEYDRSKGRIGADLAYRLPSDHEWSCAIGISGETASDTPQDKRGRFRDVYPWGKAWPPPKEAGNYSGAEIEAGRIWPNQQALPDWRDEFVQTAPVGSFAPNSFGLFDLSGNVYEWCADLLAPNRTERVLRGSSFADSFKERVAASYRLEVRPASRRPDAGFRVVLAPATNAGPAPAKP